MPQALDIDPISPKAETEDDLFRQKMLKRLDDNISAFDLIDLVNEHCPPDDDR